MTQNPLIMQLIFVNSLEVQTTFVSGQKPTVKFWKIFGVSDFIYFFY